MIYCNIDLRLIRAELAWFLQYTPGEIRLVCPFITSNISDANQIVINGRNCNPLAFQNDTVWLKRGFHYSAYLVSY